jgi:leucyl aminopeptidase
LCDALAYACEGKPALVIDLATLTGAARVALGPLNSTLPSTFSVTGDPRLNEINELRGFLC